MMDHLTHENFRVDLPRAEREKNAEREVQKMDEIERKTRLGFRENFGNFLEKICGGAEEGEESCFNFWVS